MARTCREVFKLRRQPKIEVPMYRKIALDLAGRICRGEFKEGSKIHGRSTMAGEYNVSPETIRRAVNLLEDMSVVEASPGSGIKIKSVLRAHAFIERYQSKESMSSLRSDIGRLIEQKQGIENEINEILGKLIDYSDRFKNTNPIIPVEITVKEDCHLIGRTISETKFWQNTGATIIGIRRAGNLILSPGPYTGFEKGDTILAVGDTEILARVKVFMEEKPIE